MEFLWVGSGYALATLGGVVGVRLITGALSPTHYGLLALALTGESLAKNLLLSPLSEAFTRYFPPAREKGQLPSFFQGALILTRRATFLLSAGVLILGVGLWLTDNIQWLGLVLGAFALSLISSYNNMFNGIQNAARQRLIVAWHKGFRAWIRFLLALALIRLLGATSVAAIWGYVLAAFLVLLSQFLFLQRKIIPGDMFDEEPAAVEAWTADLFQYAWPFMSWGIFTWMQLSSEQWALQVMASTKEVGLYTVLYQLGYYPVAIMATVLVQLISPILYNRAGDGSDMDRIVKTHRMNLWLIAGVLTLTLLGTGLAFFFHEWIFSVFAATAYRNVSALLPWMVFAGGLFASAQVISLSFLSELNSRTLIAPKIFTALIGLGLNIAGVYWFALPGAVFAKVTFSVIYFLWVLFYLTDRLQAIPDLLQDPIDF